MSTLRFSTGDLADLLGVRRETVWKWVKRGLLPKPTQGVGCKLHRLVDVLAAIDEHSLRIDPRALNILRVGVSRDPNEVQERPSLEQRIGEMVIEQLRDSKFKQ